MKTLIIITMLSLPLFAQNITRFGGSISNGQSNLDPAYSAVKQTEDQPLKISASKIKAAQWGLIFTNQISKMYMIDNSGKWWQSQEYTFTQGTWNMKSKSFGPSKSYLKISQNIGGNLYLCYPYKEYDPFVIDIKSSSYVDGQELYFYYGPTTETFSYSTVLGAKKNVRVMTLIEEPTYSNPTFEQFMVKIKEGLPFKIIYKGSVICTLCKGTGKVKVAEESKTDISGRYAVNTRKAENSMSNSRICSLCKAKGLIEREFLHVLASN